MDKILFRSIKVIVTILVIALVVLLVYSIFQGDVIRDAKCRDVVRDMHMNSRYNYGCQIEVEEGMWIPLENYRYMK